MIFHSCAIATLTNLDQIARIIVRYLFAGDRIDYIHGGITSRHRITAQATTKSFLSLQAPAEFGSVPNDDMPIMEVQARYLIRTPNEPRVGLKIGGLFRSGFSLQPEVFNRGAVSGC